VFESWRLGPPSPSEQQKLHLPPAAVLDLGTGGLDEWPTLPLPTPPHTRLACVFAPPTGGRGQSAGRFRRRSSAHQAAAGVAEGLERPRRPQSASVGAGLCQGLRRQAPPGRARPLTAGVPQNRPVLQARLTTAGGKKVGLLAAGAVAPAGRSGSATPSLGSAQALIEGSSSPLFGAAPPQAQAQAQAQAAEPQPVAHEVQGRQESPREDRISRAIQRLLKQADEQGAREAQDDAFPLADVKGILAIPLAERRSKTFTAPALRTDGGGSAAAEVEREASVAKTRATAAERPACRLLTSADEYRIHMGHLVTVRRKAYNRRLQKQLDEFDTRWASQKPAYYPGEEDNDDDDIEDKLKPRDDLLRKALVVDLVAGLKDVIVSSGIGEREVQQAEDNGLYRMAYVVERQSSQHFEFPAASLLGPGGVWKSSSGHVKHEFIVFELQHGPHTVSGIELGIADTMATPRRCRVQYSMKNGCGPWQDAWNFSVESPGVRTSYRSLHHYGEDIRIFSQSLVKLFGSIEKAWQALSPNGSPTMSLDDLTAFFKQLHHNIPRDCSNPARGALVAEILAIDHRDLFRECDLEHDGKIKVTQLLADLVQRPVAQFWRLLMLDTWGCRTHHAVGGPVTLLSVHPQALPRRERPRHSVFGEASGTDEGEFEGGTAEEVEQRRLMKHLAVKHNIGLPELQELHEQFMGLDLDGGGSISREEFQQLLMKTFKLADASELTPSRQDYYWKMIVQASNQTAIQFEDFLKFCVQLRNNKPSGAVISRQDPHLDAMRNSFAARQRPAR